MSIGISTSQALPNSIPNLISMLIPDPILNLIQNSNVVAYPMLAAILYALVQIKSTIGFWIGFVTRARFILRLSLWVWNPSPEAHLPLCTLSTSFWSTIKFAIEYIRRILLHQRSSNANLSMKLQTRTFPAKRKTLIRTSFCVLRPRRLWHPTL